VHGQSAAVRRFDAQADQLVMYLRQYQQTILLAVFSTGRLVDTMFLAFACSINMARTDAYFLFIHEKRLL
jgi:hypothetical protein